MRTECPACRKLYNAPSNRKAPRCFHCGAPTVPLTAPREEANAGERLVECVQCPHCWFEFAPEKVLWIAESEEYLGDAVLGPHEPMRFSASRFNEAGLALDPKGLPCPRLACPRCHLPLAAELMLMKPSFVSIVGAPGSGKSFLLASLTHALRKLLPSAFRLAFNDIDAEGNAPLLDYERALFHDDGTNDWVALRKTETQGLDLYREVMVEGVAQRLPRPLQFAVHPLPGHPAFVEADGEAPDSESERIRAAVNALALVLYDNAGESFLPGADAYNSPVTRHVAHSRGMVFIVDPTKDAHFRAQLSGRDIDDPQARKGREVFRQDVMLGELAQRIRRLLNLTPVQRHQQPLVVAVSKFDLWHDLLSDPPSAPPVVAGASGPCAYDRALIDAVSEQVRNLLSMHCPEIVSVAESNWASVRFVPFSATGCSPREHPETKMLGLRPDELRPLWPETPFLHLLDAMTDWMK